MESLKRFPFFLIFVMYALFLGYQLYIFHFDPAGDVEMHKAKITALQGDIKTLKEKLAEGQRFLQSLETKRSDIQALVKKLGEYQGTMSESLDVPAMIKMIVTEARRSGLKVDKIEPGKRDLKEYYLEQEFKIDVHGNFSQNVSFFQRVSQLQRVLRVESFSLKPQTTASTLKNTTLESKLSVRAYQYVMSQEDNIGKGGR